MRDDDAREEQVLQNIRDSAGVAAHALQRFCQRLTAPRGLALERSLTGQHLPRRTA